MNKPISILDYVSDKYWEAIMADEKTKMNQLCLQKITISDWYSKQDK